MQTCDVVITMLSNDEAVKSFENENGLLSQDNPGKLIINMSTVSPETSRYLKSVPLVRFILWMLRFRKCQTSSGRHLSYFGRRH
jgi:3-hydroxyisobutyrate dehydrogenase